MGISGTAAVIWVASAGLSDGTAQSLRDGCNNSVQPVSAAGFESPFKAQREPETLPEVLTKARADQSADTPNPNSAGQDEVDEEIVVTAVPRGRDPMSRINIASYKGVQALDRAVVAPSARAWEKVMPVPAREGLRNALSNLLEPVVFLNDLLQFKPVRAGRTLVRFGINSTLGVGGLFDIAKRKPFRLPYRSNGFANTLGYHGVKPGPYLYLPLIGPTTVRDLIGQTVDLSVLPTAAGSPFNTRLYSVGSGMTKSLNDRIALDLQLKTLQESANPYAATREFYLQSRRAEINALHSIRYQLRMGGALQAGPLVPDQRGCPSKACR